MTSPDEEKKIVCFFEEAGRGQDLVVYACTSGPPLGIAADVAAQTLGVEWIERHLTLEPTWKDTDQAASLEPAGLRRLCRNVNNVHLALKHKPQEILPIE